MAHSEAAAQHPAAAGSEPILQVEHATHRFGDVVALDDVSITARRGEFLTLLGESGSGKTTLLRIVAGLERPTRIARIAIDGEDVSAIPASRRNCTTVFQHYALFPHMSVGQNVEYGLRVRGIDREHRRKRAEDTLDLVRLLDKYARRVHQLSGGERQRVALARALVTEPAILLLDEPLGALDEKLRVDMQVELLDLHEKLGLTFIYVTHSQEEALTMSDRIILLRRGRIVQEGPPADLFDRPATRFVADFMGVENLLEGTVESVADGTARVRIGGHLISGAWSGTGPAETGAPACVAVRAERIRLAARGAAVEEAGVNRLPCTSGATIYKGKYLDQTLETDIGPVKARIWDRGVDVADQGALWWRQSECAITSAANGAGTGASGADAGGADADGA